MYNRQRQSQRNTVRSSNVPEGPSSQMSEIISEVEQGLELIKESLVAIGDSEETDFDASITHVFVVLGASVGYSL